jgi:septal ring factor EnvC (AmiA/AmiB activator)
LGSARFGKDLVGICAVALLCGLAAALLAIVPSAGAESLRENLATAREEADMLSAELRRSDERLAVAQDEAAAAAARERRLSGLLAVGAERTAELGRAVERSRGRFAASRARLRRAHRALAERLVAIYESGVPDAATLVLGSGSYEDLLSRAAYLSRIAESDRALADRVAQVRDRVHREVEEASAAHERAVAYEERLAAARTNIAAVRDSAQASAAQLQSLSASREATLAELRADIDGWVAEVREARAASAAAAEEEVGRWLGGPYSIPTYIVMCESGGDYSALNPSSGAGGAYQIIPSTWALYGGEGEPQNAPKAEQDRIAAEIWADSGPSAWSCA